MEPSTRGTGNAVAVFQPAAPRRPGMGQADRGQKLDHGIALHHDMVMGVG